ncbi:bifunctional oligoribonuclease/PAP phosphatase NrnA [bacterium]|nr:bifunctional oligoribonuclease/PAP phosphatase NrnA [bacterium]
MATPYHRAAVELRHATSVVVCAHVRPDGDAIGSVLGLTLALREAGIPAVPTLANEDRNPPVTYGWLPGFALYTAAADLEVPQVFVALDTPNFDRLGAAEHLARGAETLIVIDHHPDNQQFGAVNIVDAHVASTAQLVWRLFDPLEVRPTPDMANCLYVGLMTDTGRFQYDNTNPQAFHDAAALVEAGVDPSEMSRLVYQERSAASLALEARVMSRLTIANGGKVAYALVYDDDFAETGAAPEEGEHLPDAIRALGGVEVVVLLRQFGANEVRGNLRAKTGFDVGSVARSLDGGGHHAAAGFTQPGTVDAVLPDLLRKLPGGQ